MPKFVFTILFVSSAVVACLASADECTNVVLIVVDDMNNDLGCYGHPQVKSPHIDRLAARGVRFDRAYCQYPVCNPSRVSMLSGLRPDRTRVFDLKTPPRSHLGSQAVFLPQYFRQQGYHTAHVGKIYHTGDEFEDPPSWDVEIRESGKHPPAAAVIRSKEHNRPVKYGIEWAELNSRDDETADGIVARRSAAMLGQLAAGDKPFFLAVGFRRPHQPYAAPKKYFDLYPPANIPPLNEPSEHLRHVPAAAFTYPPGTPQLDEIDRQEIVAAYYASISFVDAQVGLVCDALDAHNLWDNTVVVFVSDHGYHLGEHGGMWHKMSLFEESARVPLVIVAPRRRGNGQACSQPVELVDVYPTLIDLCHLPAVDKLDGKSLEPLLDRPADSQQAAAFTQVLRGEIQGRSVRTARWRYTEWDQGRLGAELYDHQKDPRELFNLAGAPAWSEVQAQLKSLLQARDERRP
jgi:uncharacterized sulfatase